jgi:hypothetical protein
MTAAIKRLKSEGWRTEGTPEFGSVFIRKANDRRLQMLTARDLIRASCNRSPIQKIRPLKEQAACVIDGEPAPAGSSGHSSFFSGAISAPSARSTQCSVFRYDRAFGMKSLRTAANPASNCGSVHARNRCRYELTDLEFHFSTDDFLDAIRASGVFPGCARDTTDKRETAHGGRSRISRRTSSRPLLHSSREGTGVEAVYMSWSLAIDAPGEQTAGGTPTTPVPGQRNTSAARVSLQIGCA